MKSLAPLALVLLVGGVWGQQQNRLPRDEAQRYAKVCVEKAALVLTDPQLTVEPDPEQASAERGEGGGAMVVPDKKLTEKKAADLGKDVLPLGQLWLRKWTLVVNGQATPSGKLRVVAVSVDDKERPMPLFLLGLRKKGEKDRELVVYAKDGEPLQVLPLRQLETGHEQPLELTWKRGDKDADSLTLNVLGKYQGELKIAAQGK